MKKPPKTVWGAMCERCFETVMTDRWHLVAEQHTRGTCQHCQAGDLIVVKYVLPPSKVKP